MHHKAKQTLKLVELRNRQTRPASTMQGMQEADPATKARMAGLQKQLGGKEVTQENMQEMEQKKQQQNEMKNNMLTQICSPEALDRINRIKLVKPESADKVEMALLTAMQRGQIKGKVDDARVKELLEQVGGMQARTSKVVIQRRNHFDSDDSDDNDDDLL